MMVGPHRLGFIAAAGSGGGGGGTARLLDDYPGAAFAWSVRLLRDGYAGAALRVRRSNDNTEQDIGFDSNGDLDETALTSFVGSNDGFVVTWYDQSGNARDATQATASQQPQIVSAGTVATEGTRPAILGGNNDILDSGFSGLADKTVWVVADTTGAGSSIRILTGYSGSGSVGDQFVLDENSGNLRYFDGGDLITLAYAQGYHLHYARRGASQLHAAFDGGTVTSGGAPNANVNPTTYKVIEEGGNDLNEFPESIQEVVVYPDDQSANRAAIETDINGYYAIY